MSLMDKPLVSVHMITYNHAPYIVKAIEGVIQQKTNFPFELVIGEDCSTDGTREIVFEYRKKYPDIIRVITSEQNVGAIKNGYRTEKACRGKYIAYCEENSLGLGNPSLEQYLNTVPVNFAVHKLLSWSEAVNRTFPFINPKIPPFNNVKESLQLIMDSADVFVVSQTPYEDLINYWETQNLTEYVQMIAGQEMGKKSHHIEIVKEVGGYRDDHVLMLGDGGGDLKAIKHNNGLFYPVPAGQEDNAWSKFPEVFELFLKESYAGDPEKQLLDNFSKALLTTPAWETSTYNHLESYREKQETRKALYARLNPQGQLLVL